VQLGLATQTILFRHQFELLQHVHCHQKVPS
jgi:hypothetical protein